MHLRCNVDRPLIVGKRTSSRYRRLSTGVAAVCVEAQTDTTALRDASCRACPSLTDSAGQVAAAIGDAAIDSGPDRRLSTFGLNSRESKVVVLVAVFFIAAEVTESNILESRKTCSLHNTNLHRRCSPERSWYKIVLVQRQSCSLAGHAAMSLNLCLFSREN